MAQYIALAASAVSILGSELKKKEVAGSAARAGQSRRVESLSFSTGMGKNMNIILNSKIYEYYGMCYYE